jgi:hypothetical protein
MTLGFYQHLSYSGFPYAPYADLAASLKQQGTAEEVIIHSNKLSLLPVVYFDRKLEQRYIADPASSGSDTLDIATQRVLGLVADGSMGEAVDDAENVRLIIFEQAISEYREAGYLTHPHIAWLEERYQETGSEYWGDIRVYRFTRPD